LHAGTLLAVFIFYRKLIADVIVGLMLKEREAWHFAVAIAVSILPAAVLGLAFDDRLDASAESPIFVCSCLIFTGLLLLSTRIWGRDDGKSVSPLRGFAMGCAQALALLPGVSRSGSTIAMARFLGIKPEKAAAFSFLMVVPVIIAGNLLHIWKALNNTGPSAFDGITPGLAIVGFVVAALVGYASVAWMVRLLNRTRFWRFGIYCVVLGIVGMIWLCCD
jgi:undecaprenyl-diphosphatase